MKTDGKSAFTLIELLVTIAIIAILASLLLSAISGGKRRARVSQCLNNKRQITLAWFLYIHDNGDWLPVNPDAQQFGNNFYALPFTLDHQSWEVLNITTNIMFLMDPAYSSLAVYAQNKEIYLCPEDNYVSPAQRAAGLQRRIRSVSMNTLMGYAETEASLTGWKAYRHYTDLGRSSPARRFVFIDEDPDTIWDGGFFVSSAGRESPWGFGRYPSALHNGGATLSFADGHAETKIWKLADTRRPVTFANWQQTENQKTDYLWLYLRTGDLKPK